MSAPSRTQVFVYGTLRRGEQNHYLLEARKPLRVGRTEARFTLVSLGPYPAMIEGGETAVLGEVYDVDPLTLAALDELEDHPTFYQRRPIRLDDGGEVLAYLLPPEQARGRRTIPSGDWLEGKHEDDW